MTLYWMEGDTRRQAARWHFMADGNQYESRECEGGKRKGGYSTDYTLAGAIKGNEFNANE